jgi:hypothetical protein
METKLKKRITNDELIAYMLQSKKEEKKIAKEFVKTKEFEEIKRKLSELNSNAV